MIRSSQCCIRKWSLNFVRTKHDTQSAEFFCLGAFTQSGKNDYQFYHFYPYVRLSLRMYQLGFRWEGFLQNLVLESFINPLNPELNPICYLLALLGAHHFLHVSRIRVKLLTFRRLMSYTYGAPILDVSRSHTTTQHSR